MYAHATDESFNRRLDEEMDRIDVLQAVASLRDELNTMANDLRTVVDENTRLRQELEDARGSRENNQSVSEIRRMKDEVDRLIGLHDAASKGKSLFQDDSSRQSVPFRGEDRSDWKKKMIMMMLLAELM